MPKSSNQPGKVSKTSTSEEKEPKKSVSKKKPESTYAKFVKAAVKVSGEETNVPTNSVSKSKGGEKSISQPEIKKVLLKRVKKPSTSKEKPLKGKSPSVRSVPKVSEKRLESSSPSKSTALPPTFPKYTKEQKSKKSTKKSVKKSALKKKERSRSKSAKKQEIQTPSNNTPSKKTPSKESNSSAKSKSSPKSGTHSSRSEMYKEITPMQKVPPKHEKTKVTKKTAKTGKSVEKPSSGTEVTRSGKVVQYKNVKESSSNIESSSSIDLSGEQKKRSGEYGPESQRISQEVETAVKRIEDKKKLRKGNLLEKKRKRGEERLVVAHTAKDYDYILQKNPNSKVKPFINLEELSKHPVINYSDVLLSLLELGQNTNSYLFAYSSKSKSFWSDILEYKVLKKIFKDFKAETLRKYWTELSKHDSDSASDLIKKNKSFLDKTPLKLGTIVNSVSKVLNGQVKNLQEYISNIQIDIRKREIFEHEFKNPVTGELTKVKEVRTTYNTRKKYEPGNTKNFNGSGINIVSLKEVYHQNSNLNDFQKVMKNIKKEDSIKENYLNEYTEEEKKRLNTINEDDKFIFKTIDNVLDVLCSEFKNYGQDYILETLQQNSLDIAKTYICLKDPMKSKIIGFTPLDDKVLLRKQGEEYKYLVKEKGKDAIQEREEYLSH